MKSILLVAILILPSFVFSQNDARSQSINQAVTKVEQKVINWRRDFHENPELSNREVRTAALVAEHLKSLGIEVKTGVAVTGVVGILKEVSPVL